MSTPRHPSRLAKYSTTGKFYPRELTELDGKLYIKNENGSITQLNKSGSTNILDSAKNNIGTVDPVNGGDITIPDASSTTRGLSMLSDAAPKAAGTASAGTGTTAARADHVHPSQTSVSGNAGTATKLQTARKIGLSGVTATAQDFDGSKAITIPITAVPASIVTGLAAVATSGAYGDLSDTPTIPSASGTTDTPKAAGTAAVGISDAYARADHVHPIQTTVSGNAGSATKLQTARKIGLSGVTATAQSFDGSGDITIPITAVPASVVTGLAKVATSGSYSDLSDTPTIPGASSTAPKAAGTAAVGTSAAYARADHVHPIQTTVSGNAGTATKLQTARKIGFSGAITATAQDFDGSQAITIPVTAIDGTKITGIIPLSSIPKGAQERLVPVEDDTARLALSSDDAQNGDVVKVQSTGIMYYVVDDTQLGGTTPEKAFEVFTAGAASSVDWTGVNNKPTFATVATSGSYNDLSNKPTIPSASSTAPKAAGTAAVGTGTTWARADHVHPLQTTVSGNAGSATKLQTARKIGLSGVTATAQSFDGSGDITIPITAVPASVVTGLAKVATSGSYSDLSDTPTIPSASGTTDTPKAAGTAAVGTSTAYARADHVHPVQTTVSGNAGSATKLQTARKIGLSGVTATAQDFDGSGNITIPITAVPASIVSGLATVATSGSYGDLSDTPSIPSAATTAPKAAGTAAVGTGTTWARADHVHPAQTTVSGNAGTATKLQTARKIGLSGVTATAQSFDGSGDITIPITAVPADVVTGLAAVATSGAYGDLSGTPSIPSAATTTPKALGTAAVGTATTWARADHVHAHNTINTEYNGDTSEFDKGDTFDVVEGIGVSNGHVTGVDTHTINIPSESYGKTAGTTSAYTVTVNDLKTLTTGRVIYVMFNAANAASATLNVNGLGAKPIYYKGAAVAASRCPANTVLVLVYDTTVVADGAWHLVYSYDSNSTYTNASLGNGFGTCSTAYATTAKVATLSSYVLQTNGYVSIRFTYGVPASATLNINSRGARAIYHGTAAITDGVIKAGDIATFVYNGSYYYLVAVSKPSNTYTANIGTTWTGSAAPYTQTITVSGMSANDNPIVDVVPSSTYETAQAQIADYAKIYKITTALNSITVYATEKTETTILIQLKCVK